jgi:hypothetical protein
MAERNYHSPQDRKQNQIVHSTLIPLLQILTVCEKQQDMEHRCLKYFKEMEHKFFNRFLGNGAQILHRFLGNGARVPNSLFASEMEM